MNDTFIVRRTSVAAVLSLLFGVLAWVMLPFLGAVIAVICGHAARAEIRRSQGTLEGDGMALAGLVLGWLHLLLVLLGVLLFFGVIGLAAGSFGLGHWMQQLHQTLHGCGTLV